MTKTGPDWAQVRSIIDDMSNVSAMILKNSDLCYVRGDLEMMSEGTLQLNQLRDQNDEVESGDKVVTSYASAKYHKGILIGYVNELAVDSNNLTKSGSITCLLYTSRTVSGLPHRSKDFTLPSAGAEAMNRHRSVQEESL